MTEHRRPHRLAFILFWSILMGHFVKGYVVTAGIITDDTMHPTLAKEGYYLVNRYIYHFVHPERGDIVVFRRWKYASVEDAKRIVGLPGETVLVKAGQVYIDGRRLDEPYAVGKTYPDSGPHTLAEGTYYVLADNRWVREDSRELGPIPLEKIKGKMKPDELFPFW